MSCGIQEEDLSALLDGELNPLEERRLRAHVAVCPGCHTVYEEIGAVSRALSAGASEVSESPAFVRRVVKEAAKSGGRSRGRILPLAVPLAAAAVLLLFLGVTTAALDSLSAPRAGEVPAVADLPDDAASVYLRRAAAIEPGDADAHLALSRYCREQGLFPAAARECLRALGADPENREAREYLASLFPSGVVPAEIAEPDLGTFAGLGPALPEPVPVEVVPATPEERYAAAGMEKEGDRWLTPEAYRRLREHREEEVLLARAEEIQKRRSVAPGPAEAPAHPVATWLASLKPGIAKNHDLLTVVALEDGGAAPALQVVSLSEAMELGIVTIVENRSSATLRAINDDPDRYVFLAFGEVLQGGHQDRILTQATLIPPKTVARLPVLCCERGRSIGITDRFTRSPGVAPPGLRRLLLGATTQEMVWGRITEDLDLLGAGRSTKTEALRKLFTSGRGAAALSAYQRSLLPVLSGERTVGFLAFSGGRLIGGEVFESHAVLESQAKRFLAAYVLEALRRAADGEERAATPLDVTKILAAVGQSTFFETASPVFGRQAEFEGYVSGSALLPVSGSRPVHVTIFPGVELTKASKSEAPAKDAGPADDPVPDEGSKKSRREIERDRERRKKATLPGGRGTNRGVPEPRRPLLPGGNGGDRNR